jgi:hypothetical protein
MRTGKSFRSCRRWILTALAVLLQNMAHGQGGIVFVQEASPASYGNMYWNALGMQVGPDFSITINGQTVFTFSSGVVQGLPTAFMIQPSSNSAVIAVQPYAFVIPLTRGQSVGPDAAGYGWLGNIFGGDVLTATWYDEETGDPGGTVGYFTGLDSAYIGLQFQQDGQTYYGWANVGCPYAGANIGWVFSYAYETTPNTPIVAGAGQPAPLAAPQIARPGNLRLNWQSVPGVPYQVQFKNQVDAPSWSNLDLTLIATSTNTLADIPMVGTAGFYRVIQVQ